ncbi:MAG: HNH endonuclease [Chloroflexi bacterium]|nr:HNH endonuclease [Chloroflexota bacterium]
MDELRRRGGPPPKTNEERFWPKVLRDPETECWNWLGAIGNGYGRFGVYHDGMRLAHRFSYQLLVGPIPDGLTIDHLCRNTTCVNPAHLEPVPIHVNLLRGDTIPGLNARKTHCPKGHPYKGRNLYLAKDGARRCRTCINAHQRAYNARQRVKAAG